MNRKREREKKTPVQTQHSWKAVFVHRAACTNTQVTSAVSLKYQTTHCKLNLYTCICMYVYTNVCIYGGGGMFTTLQPRPSAVLQCSFVQPLGLDMAALT